MFTSNLQVIKFCKFILKNKGINMVKVVVLGAGTGGMPAAYETKEILGKDHEVVMVNERPDFRFVPSNPWVAVGWREPEAITIPIEKYLSKKKIGFICARVVEIDAKNNQMKTESGDIIDYDYLIIATGPKLAFANIEGAGPDYFTHRWSPPICQAII